MTPSSSCWRISSEVMPERMSSYCSSVMNLLSRVVARMISQSQFSSLIITFHSDSMRGVVAPTMRGLETFGPRIQAPHTARMVQGARNISSKIISETFVYPRHASMDSYVPK